ncbi:MAG: DUF3592 domain-containing protein [Candidatus Methylacidiphilales bacterium]|nr:DUF3592 domain-containing protein [Candidatus Methylacidiphilales bacterium]
MTFLWIILILLFFWAVAQPWVPNTFVAILLLFIIWTTGTVYYDAVVAMRIAEHWQTAAFKEVEADVLASVDNHRQVNRTHTFDPKIAYAYTAEGRRYTNFDIQRGGYGKLESAEEIYYFIKDRPSGSKTAAFYNPADPAESVLKRGVPGIEVFFLLCLLPFNMFSIVSLTYLVHSWRMARTKSPTAGFRTTETATGFRIQLPPRNSLWYDFCCYIAGMSLAGIAFCGVYMLYRPLLAGDVIKAGVVVTAVAACLTIYRAWLYSRGRFDMEADLTAGTLKLPSARGRQERKVVSLADCDAIKIRTVERDPDAEAARLKAAAAPSSSASVTADSKSGKSKNRKSKDKDREKAALRAAAAKGAELTYRLEVLMKGAPNAQEDEKDRAIITEIEDKEPALRFATWLAGKLNLRRLGQV